MSLLDPIVEVGIAAMHDLLAERFTDRSRIGVVAVGRDMFRHLPSHLQRSGEEPFGCVHIPMLTQHRIDEVAITIDGAVEILPVASDADVRFVRMPGATSLTLPFLPAGDPLRGERSGLPSRARLRG